MNNAKNNLQTQTEGLYQHFEKNLTPFITDGDVPTNLREKVELIHDQIAELYLMTVNSDPVIKVTKQPIIPEITNGQHATTN